MKTILFSILFILAIKASAQTSHFISIKGNAGNSSLLYDLNDGERIGSLGLGAELNYHLFFNENWGIGSGLGFSTSKTTGILTNYSTASGILSDSQGDEYTSLLDLYNWEEMQEVNFLEIPILFSFQQGLGFVENLVLYADAGLKVQIPLSANYKVVEGDFENRAYYEQWNVTLDNVPGRFERVSDYLPSGDIKLKTSFALTANVGIIYPINDRWDVFGGLAIDYGLNNLQNAGSNLLQESLSRTYNGLIHSELLSSVRPMAIKAEFGLRFRLGEK